MVKKYQGLGRVGGSVTLKDLTDQEREAISLFLGRDYTGQRSATIALDTFMAALDKTRFAGIEFKALLDGYAGHDILTRAEKQERHKQRKAAFFRELAAKHTSEWARLWLDHVQKSGAGTRGIHQAFDKEPEALFRQLENVLTALDRLAAKHQGGDPSFVRLPVFASQAVRDPHGFDLDTEQGRYLVAALQLIRGRRDPAYAGGRRQLSAQEITELFGYFGIIRDDLLNFVTCAGLLAFREGHEPVAWWRAAWDDGAVLNVPLREMAGVNRVLPAVTFGFVVRPRQVFVVENSGVFSEIVDQFTGAPLPPLVCTHGQFKLACLLLLDKLVAENTVICYSGDFDPEGLQMAERLVRRYPGQVVLWRYTVEDYRRCISEVALPASRLKKLDTIDQPQLVPVREAIRASGKAGYQEYLVQTLISDIQSATGATGDGVAD